MNAFQEKLAVVTGGGNGIGRELVVQLAAAGCSVATCDLDETALRQTAAKAADGMPEGTRVTTHACDVGDEASVGRFRDEVVEQHRADHVDLVFNNVGIVGGGSFVAGDRAAWDRTFRVCWGGVYHCSRAFMPLLTASDDAWLVNTSSVNGFWATHLPGQPNTAYSAAKFAVKGFTEALIEDFRVNAPHVKAALVMPGAIGTGIGLNSARVMRDGELDGVRAKFLDMGLAVRDAGDDELRRLLAIWDAVAAEFFPTSPPAAAASMLDGLRAGRWRILVGEDARRLDAQVRADPEGAYEPGFPGLEPGWWLPMFLLRARFDPRAAADLTVTCELRFRAERISVRVADGQLELARRAANGPDATLDVDPRTLLDLVAGEEALDHATRRGALTLTGDRAKVERLLAAVAAPAA